MYPSESCVCVRRILCLCIWINTTSVYYLTVRYCLWLLSYRPLLSKCNLILSIAWHCFYLFIFLVYFALFQVILCFSLLRCTLMFEGKKVHNFPPFFAVRRSVTASMCACACLGALSSVPVRFCPLFCILKYSINANDFFMTIHERSNYDSCLSNTLTNTPVNLSRRQ